MRKALALLLAVVPGLAVFVSGFALPTDLRRPFAIALQLAVFAPVAWLMLHENDIRRAGRRRVGKWILRMFFGALALLLIYVWAYSTVVMEHHYYPGRPVRILVPKPVSAWISPKAEHFLDCQIGWKLGGSRPDSAPTCSTQDVADAITRYGPDSFLIQRGAYWIAWVAGLFLVYTAVVSLLVSIFVIAVFRGADIQLFLQRHLQSGRSGRV